jgi:Mg-chelatase subunit ChlD
MHASLRASIRSLLVTASVTILATLPLAAQGWIVPRPCAVIIRPAEGWPERPIRDCRPNVVRSRSDVRVELVDHVLHYEVEERFINRGAAVGEADYLFQLPNNAAFQDLELSINGELVAGETMNAGDARRTYENIVRTQRDPALVEWMGHGLLRARIFPLNPGEEKRIVVRFQRVAPREGDAMRVDYFRGGALTVGDGGMSSFALTYTPTRELGTPYSPTHSLDMSERDGKRVAAVRGDARDVTTLVPVTAPPLARNEMTPRDITLVLDVSGSMQGRKMEQARAAGRQLLGTLRADDRFRLIDFASDVRTFRDDFVAATPSNLRDAVRYLDALEAQGGTNIEGALREAVRPSAASGRLPLVPFVTDGEPTVGDQRPDHLAAIAAADDRTPSPRRIFTFGLGSDVNVSLLEQLAIEGRGTAQFVRPEESVERTVGIVADRLVDPALTDVRIHVAGDVKLSRLLPPRAADIFADRDLVVLTRYTGHGTARVVVDGTRRGAPVQWTAIVSFPERERANPFVARLWAAQRVGFLSAEKRKSAGSSEVDDEIRMLGERYGIPTEFTSYLVTEPRFAINRAGGMPAAPAGMRVQEMRDARFEQAKTAPAQRASSSIAAVDSVMSADVRGTAAGATSTRRVEGRTFTMRDGAWVDARYNANMSVSTIKAYSRAYFDVMDQLAELRAVFAIGSRVTVAGRKGAITIGDKGVSEMSAAALSALAKAW